MRQQDVHGSCDGFVAFSHEVEHNGPAILIGQPGAEGFHMVTNHCEKDRNSFQRFERKAPQREAHFSERFLRQPFLRDCFQLLVQGWIWSTLSIVSTDAHPAFQDFVDHGTKIGPLASGQTERLQIQYGFFRNLERPQPQRMVGGQTIFSTFVDTGRPPISSAELQIFTNSRKEILVCRQRVSARQSDGSSSGIAHQPPIVRQQQVMLVALNGKGRKRFLAVSLKDAVDGFGRGFQTTAQNDGTQ